MTRWSGSVILSTLGVAACGGDGGTTVPGLDASTPASFDDGIARLEVQSRSFGNGDGATSVSGALLQWPAPWPYEGPQVDGVCRMWRRRPIDSCQPLCDFDQVCDGGTCLDEPVSASAGTLIVEGGGAREEVPYQLGYQLYVARPLFAPGTLITVRAPGAELAAFSVEARLPSPLVLEDVERLVLAPGTPLTLRWTPRDGDARVRVTLGADLGHGRHRSVVVECDVADFDGGVAIPQAMVDELADPASWSCGDCFPHEVRRYRRGDISVDGLPLTLWAVQAESLYLVP